MYICIDVADEYTEECRGMENSEATVGREWSYYEESGV